MGCECLLGQGEGCVLRSEFPNSGITQFLIRISDFNSDPNRSCNRNRNPIPYSYRVLASNVNDLHVTYISLTALLFEGLGLGLEPPNVMHELSNI